MLLFLWRKANSDDTPPNKCSRPQPSDKRKTLGRQPLSEFVSVCRDQNGLNMHHIHVISGSLFLPCSYLLASDIEIENRHHALQLVFPAMNIILSTNQATKHASTLTDIYGSGETEVYVLDVDSAQSDFEDIKTKCIRPRNNPFLDNFVASPIELKATNPFLDNFDDFADVKKETNPFKTDIHSNEKTLLLYQEDDEPPQIDPSWFEMDEPELIEIFENTKNVFSVLDNPSENDFATNPFLARNPFELTNKNTFKKSIIANSNPFSGISNEQKMSELNTCSCPKQDNLTLVASRPNHYLKRKANKVASWLKSRNLVTNSPCYLKLK
ncbi:hypothetical protein HNY73_017992 [Argiope bruennichi]|uniref:Uncharacterized protein n=1 Tax=Argiope bruennichi TaxID=94029 RepID=A0A8T0EBS7_ARGBR|nr:hypothetical protein HNY73_017992 [Argiope bruennichi]